jgi:hypothetical protein
MAEVIPQATPNPQAYKFTIEGHSFGAPVTLGGADEAAGTPFEGLFQLPGVVSLFATSNFVTLMKEPAADWDGIVPQAVQLLQQAF